MTARIRPISRGNIIVWPLVPRLTSGVNLARQNGDHPAPNVVILPMVRFERAWMADIRLLNNIDVIRATMRNQRTNKRMARRNTYALEKLKRDFLNPA